MTDTMDSTHDSLVNPMKVETILELPGNPVRVEPSILELPGKPVKVEPITIGWNSGSENISGRFSSLNNAQLPVPLIAKSIKEEACDDDLEGTSLLKSECVMGDCHLPFMDHGASCPVRTNTSNVKIYSDRCDNSGEKWEDSPAHVTAGVGDVMTAINTEGFVKLSCPLHDHHNAIFEGTQQVPVNVKYVQNLQELDDVDYKKNIHIKDETVDLGSSMNNLTGTEIEFHETSSKPNGVPRNTDSVPKRYSQSQLSAPTIRTSSEGSSKKKQHMECPICNKRVSSKRNLQDHVRVHTGERPFKCTECDKCFAQSAHLRRHTFVHTGEKPHECPICGKGFARPSELKEHHRIHTGQKPLHCPHCDRSFARSSCLRLHIIKHHPHTEMTDKNRGKKNSHKTYTCSVCDKSYYTGSDLNRHTLTHTGAKPHICRICGQSFSHSGHLNVHMRSHTGETPFMCPTCNKGFCRSTHLKYHMATHLKEKPHKCDMCNKSYGTPQGLNSHYQSKYHLRNLKKK